MFGESVPVILSVCFFFVRSYQKQVHCEVSSPEISFLSMTSSLHSACFRLTETGFLLGLWWLWPAGSR